MKPFPLKNTLHNKIFLRQKIYERRHKRICRSHVFSGKCFLKYSYVKGTCFVIMLYDHLFYT